jgi:hypothetical protein
VKQPTSKRRVWSLVAVVAAVLLLGPLVVPLFVPWSAINCRDQEINIKTGQARYSRSLWFVRLPGRIEDTPLSRALHNRTIDVADIEPWHRVNTFSLGLQHSPHYVFHGAFAQARDMGTLQRIAALDSAATAAVAEQVLVEWQTSGNDSTASDLLDEKLLDAYRKIP